jgi:hypothetical protein
MDRRIEGCCFAAAAYCNSASREACLRGANGRTFDFRSVSHIPMHSLKPVDECIGDLPPTA